MITPAYPCAASRCGKTIIKAFEKSALNPMCIGHWGMK